MTNIKWGNMDKIGLNGEEAETGEYVVLWKGDYYSNDYALTSKSLMNDDKERYYKAFKEVFGTTFPLLDDMNSDNISEMLGVYFDKKVNLTAITKSYEWHGVGDVFTFYYRIVEEKCDKVANNFKEIAKLITTYNKYRHSSDKSSEFIGNREELKYRIITELYNCEHLLSEKELNYLYNTTNNIHIGFAIAKIIKERKKYIG